jgi:hypothetical protein
MAPIAVETETPPSMGNGTLPTKARGLQREPLKASGLLDHHKFFESTTIIGREYPNVQIADLMQSPQKDQYIRDLAITGRRLILNFVSHLLISLSLREMCSLFQEARWHDS